MRYFVTDLREATEFANTLMKTMDSKRIFIFDIAYNDVRIQTKSIIDSTTTTILEYCSFEEGYRFLQGFNSSILTLDESQNSVKVAPINSSDVLNHTLFSPLVSLLKKIY